MTTDLNYGVSVDGTRVILTLPGFDVPMTIGDVAVVAEILDGTAEGGRGDSVLLDDGYCLEIKLTAVGTRLAAWGVNDGDYRKSIQLTPHATDELVAELRSAAEKASGDADFIEDGSASTSPAMAAV